MTDEQAEKILNETLGSHGTVAAGDAGVKCSLQNQRDPKRILKSPTDQDFIESLRSARDMDEPESSTYLERAQNFSEQANAGRCGITKAEVAAIGYYTGSGYRYVNSALRHGDKDELAKWSKFIRLLTSALEKLAPYEGVVRRGAEYAPAEVAANSKGNWITFRTFISTSPTNEFGGKDRTVFYVRSCRDIHSLSTFNSENEVLCRPGLKFLVRYAIKSEYENRYLLEESPPNIARKNSPDRNRSRRSKKKRR